MAAVRRFIARLKTTWGEINEFENASDNVDKLGEVINKCVPDNELEVTVGDGYRYMYNENRDLFERYITNTHMQHLSLVLDGKLAHKLLGLPDDIIISWNLMAGKFNVYSKGEVPATQVDSRRVRREFKNNRREQRDTRRNNKKDIRKEKRDTRRNGKNDNRRERRDNRRENNRVMTTSDYDSLFEDITEVIEADSVEDIVIISANNTTFTIDESKASFRDVLLRGNEKPEKTERLSKLTSSWADLDEDTELAPIEGFGTIQQ